ncbi:HpcH/HpaI aldolase family protein [Amycolatopsis pigmentata]|uniref:HpcH/HpaI aldolase/citrate lyase family protein n=1 Tax=Amycolatopsis pigmentata TaxID=450801 RepID=A0ABW5G6T0_9PSEU
MKIPAPEVSEIVAGAGFDFVVIDTEHALLSVRDVYTMIVNYSSFGVLPLVRVTDHGYGDAQRYLDAGAAGIFVPHVSNGSVAEDVMSPLLFPPKGSRGMGFSSRAGKWGSLDGGRAEYLRYGDEDAVRVAMVEERESIDKIADILAAPGVDAIFVGAGDLAVSMGVPGGDSQVKNAVDHAINEAVKAGVPVGAGTRGAEDARKRREQGCSFIIAGNDAGMLVKASKATASSMREGVSR